MSGAPGLRHGTSSSPASCATRCGGAMQYRAIEGFRTLPEVLAAEGAQEREACDGPEREVDDHEVRLLV